MFEGWFGSEADFQSQLSSSLISCPLCGDKTIVKMLSAPRINFGVPQPNSSQLPSRPPVPSRSNAHTTTPSARATHVTPLDPDPSLSLSEASLQVAWLTMVRYVVANTEDVGNQFAEEARKMHYGDADERGIRGQATHDETEALLEEGIAILPMPPLPAGLTGPLQ